MKTSLRKIRIVLITALMVVLMVPVSASAKTKTVRKTAVTLNVGKSKTVKISGKKKAKWTTSNKKIASISTKKGLSTKVTAKKAGNATITAKFTSGKTTKQYIWKITVKKKAAASSASTTTTVNPPSGNTGSSEATEITVIGGDPTPSGTSSTAANTSGSSSASGSASSSSGTTSTSSSSGSVSPLKAGMNETLPDHVSGSDQAATYYNKMIAMKTRAGTTEGATWSNATYRRFNGQNSTDCTWDGGYGCAGFAMLLSDAAFGTAPSTKSTDLNTVKVGDMVVFNDGLSTVHWVMVMKVVKTSAGVLDYMVVAEGNYTNEGIGLKTAVHWGRVIEASRCYTAGMNFSFLVTRY